MHEHSCLPITISSLSFFGENYSMLLVVEEEERVPIGAISMNINGAVQHQDTCMWVVVEVEEQVDIEAVQHQHHQPVAYEQ